MDFAGNHLSESELERQRERIPRGPQAIRNREYHFTDDLIVDDSGAPDAKLKLLVTSLIEVLRLGGPYGLVYQLWSQFTLTASRMNIDVTWSRDEVLVGTFLLNVSEYPYASAYWCCVLVDHFEREVPSHPFWSVRLSEGAWIVQHSI